MGKTAVLVRVEHGEVNKVVFTACDVSRSLRIKNMKLNLDFEVEFFLHNVLKIEQI